MCHLKILAILWNPVDRAWSHYGMGGSRGKHRGGASKPFVVLVDKEIHHLIRSGILEKAVSSAQFER